VACAFEQQPQAGKHLEVQVLQLEPLQEEKTLSETTLHGLCTHQAVGEYTPSRQRKENLPTRRSLLLNPKIGLCPEIRGFISLAKLSFNLLLILEILVIHIKFLILFSNPISQALLASTMFWGNKFQSFRHCPESRHRAGNLAFLALPPQPLPGEWKGSSYG